MNLAPYINAIEEQHLNVEGIIVHQNGEDLARHRFTPEKRRPVFSVSKSFTSIAIGMAIEEGKLGLGDRVTAVFPRTSPDTRWESLTLSHLLTMTMGHPEFARPQSVEEALSFAITRDPGTRFLYDNTCTFLASAMFTRATGKTVRDYLDERLFSPLGIASVQWEESIDGYTVGGSGLSLTTSEMSLFGRFLLARGAWEGRQLVSAAWIDGATRTQVSPRFAREGSGYDLGYGYQFWTCLHGAYRCDGRNGQFIVVFPALDAVVSVNSDEENMMPILTAVYDHILPVLKKNRGLLK